MDELAKIRDLIEQYDVGFLEADEGEQEVPIYWAVKTLIEEHETLTAELDRIENPDTIARSRGEREAEAAAEHLAEIELDSSTSVVR